MCRVTEITEEWPPPITTKSLEEDLYDLGVTKGMVLIVHCSLRSIGTVWGGAPAVILALENTIGEEGTLVMPTQTCHMLDPKGGKFTKPPKEWFVRWKDVIYESIPAYDPDLTPTDYMGWVAECFRKQKGVIRSSHPYVSFAAWGKHAEQIISNHSLDFPDGGNSSLAKIYDLNGWILLIGVGYDVCTSLHLAEHRANYRSKRIVETRAPMIVNGTRQWVVIKGINSDDYSDFDLVGESFEKETDFVKRSKIGDSPSVLIPQVELVDYAAKWFSVNQE